MADSFTLFPDLTFPSAFPLRQGDRCENDLCSSNYSFEHGLSDAGYDVISLGAAETFNGQYPASNELSLHHCTTSGTLHGNDELRLNSAQLRRVLHDSPATAVAITSRPHFAFGGADHEQHAAISPRPRYASDSADLEMPGPVAPRPHLASTSIDHQRTLPGVLTAAFGKSEVQAFLRALAKLTSHPELSRSTAPVPHALQPLCLNLSPTMHPDVQIVDYVYTPVHGTIVRQQLYKPGGSRKCGYTANVTNVALHKPIWFVTMAGLGVPLQAARGPRAALAQLLRGAFEQALALGMKTTANVCVHLHGQDLFKSQIRMEGTAKAPLLLVDLVRRCASAADKLFTTETSRRGHLRRDALMLLGCVNVSKGTWQLVLAMHDGVSDNVGATLSNSAGPSSSALLPLPPLLPPPPPQALGHSRARPLSPTNPLSQT